ncbi:MAG: fatty acid desaturase [Chlamydiia bacterium]|nr:fatty acid desaturase [Chlamydiia bacterium]
MQINRNKNWGPFIFLVSYQLLTLLALPFYFWYAELHWQTFVWMAVFYFAGGLAITAGYHRLFSHRCYKASPIVEAVVTFLGSTTMQGSVIRWCYDHRQHHAHVDTDLDPYTIKKGFLFAHMLWLFEKPRPIEQKVVSDLYQKPLVSWQHRHDVIAMFGSNALLYLFCALMTGDWLGSFVIAVCLRLFLLHHCTWFINSLAHTWGDQPFCKEHTAVNNFIISILTFGEGYHNFHHTYAHDYRNGVRWYQFDPTKWLIFTLSKLGLADSLRRVDEFAIRKKILRETLSAHWDEKLKELSLKLEERMASYQNLATRYHKLKKERPDKAALISLKKELKEMRKQFRAEWRNFFSLVKV